MNLTMLPIGKEGVIDVCRVKDATKKFLEGLGIVPGTVISIVAEMQGNLIVNIKGSRIALSKGIAQQLILEK